MQPEQARIIENFPPSFEAMRVRPKMYLGEVSERALSCYLNGFHTACEMLEIQHDVGIYWQVCAERGWEANALGPQKRMRDQGWEEAAIVEELLVIEIETWKRTPAGD